jgi:hypothetical protein
MTKLPDKKGLKSANPASGGSGPTPARTGRRSSGTIDHVAASLRQAYRSTLDEDVPDALMDLLRKLD